MTIPRGKIVYENLDSSIINFAELLSNLNATEFTGYMQFNLPGLDGIFYLENGKITDAFCENADNKQMGQDAVNEIIAKIKVKENSGKINVFEMPGDIVKLLANLGKGEIVYQDLSNDFSSLENLLTKLKNEGHNGYLEISTDDKKTTALIFLQQGEPVKSIMSTPEHVASKPVQSQDIIDVTSKTKVTFNVYKAALSLSDSREHLITVYEINEILEVWAAIINAIEKQTDPKTFTKVFKQTLIDKADEYPFLDPFATEFQYADAKASFEGDATKDFNKGLAESLQITMSNLGIPGATVKEFQNIKNQFADIINKYSFNNELNKLITS
ncbi:DUF4388 domain-containing protein [candidate division KSB1 bacterium]|nr:DUF4388 domain-containing protein [candidate division KSB1 bacterium]MBL7092618.1 DUF4388 domain-containing protein [candidate division KSB1 bacterium]